MAKKNAGNRAKNALPRSITSLSWTIVASVAIAQGLPLLFELYLSVTPQLAPHLERESKTIAELVARFIAYSVFVLGCLLAYKRWREEQKIKTVQKKIQAFRERKRKEMVEVDN